MSRKICKVYSSLDCVGKFCEDKPCRKLEPTVVIKIKAHFFKDDSGAIVAFNSPIDKRFKPCVIVINRKYMGDHK